MACRYALAVFIGLAFLGGCDRDEMTRSAPSAGADAQKAKDQAGSKKNQPAQQAPADGGKATTGEDSDKTEAVAAAASACLGEMVAISGGEFWVGTEREVYDREENPKFKARLTNFCVDRLEVSTTEYEACVSVGKCKAIQSTNKTCNTVAKGKGDHPINCINHEQAKAVCAHRGARLMTEIEWEYIARGGSEMRDYPWGSAHPDDNTCWKHPGSCTRGSYTEEAFGLKDVVGNVWEWTDSWFGRYPWPAQTGRHKVYRGGSWSRRFEKWMKPTLRNRLDPKESGSHLGVRCAYTPPAITCPAGRNEAGACHHQILEVMCLDGDKWNGVRCARPDDERQCLPPASLVEGYGCVREPIVGKVAKEVDVSGVTRSRSPEFDADCVKNSPGRPKAYRFTGGGHLARNIVGKKQGCKNRDVGVGFNSSCCP